MGLSMFNSTAAQHELADPPGDAISALTFSPGEHSDRLLVASWDLHLHLYDTSAPTSTSLLRKYQHPAPLLAACFGADATTAFSAGIDFAVRRIDLASGAQEVLSIHGAPACALAYDARHNILFSASWDGTLHMHHLTTPSDTAAPPLPATIPLPAKPMHLAISASKLTVSMAGRLLHIYDLASLHQLGASASQPPPNTLAAEPLQTRESSLKFMIRAIAARADDSGYVCASIEGRVAVEWFDAGADAQAKKYAFKCHRQPNAQAPEDGDVVYPVHALAVHPTLDTFATGGGDGVVALWDAANKRRIRQYQKFPESVAAVAFSGNGRLMAVGVCGGFEDGGIDGEQVREARVFVRELAEGECRGKEKK